MGICDKLSYMKFVFFDSRRFLVLMEAAFMGVFYYNLLLWMPFYFANSNYKEAASYLSIISPLFNVIGSFCFEGPMKLCQKYSHWIISFILLLHAIAYYFILEISKTSLQDSSNLGLYFILLSIGNLFFACFICIQGGLMNAYH